MTPVLTYKHEPKLGTQAHKLRMMLHLTQQELADMADVSAEAVGLFEHNLPLPLDYKRRILRELWAEKTKK